VCFPGANRVVRYASVDALRGLTVAAMLLVNNPGDWGHVYRPLQHAQWHGCTPTDLIFPFFLFVVGVSLALGLVPQLGRDAGRRALHRKAYWRATKIIGLGLLLHLLAFWWLDQDRFRPWGVLQRIGLCFLLAAGVALHMHARMQWWLIAALLLGYWAVLGLAGGYAPLENPASRIDTWLIGPMNYQFDPATGRGHDPEGLLSTLGALATTLLGLRAGDWLRRGQSGVLLLAGLAALLFGGLWSLLLPLNKNLWTPSYAVWTAGWATLALWAASVLIDRRGMPAPGRRFGVNAIAAYAGSAVMAYGLAALGWWEPAYRVGFADWMTPLFGPYLPSLAFAVGFVSFWWIVVWWMDRRGWYVKL
jgi:predicted acyltransferase